MGLPAAIPFSYNQAQDGLAYIYHAIQQTASSSASVQINQSGSSSQWILNSNPASPLRKHPANENLDWQSILPLLPAGVVALRAIVLLLQMNQSHNLKGKQKETEASTRLELLIAYFSPFVSAKDVEENRLAQERSKSEKVLADQLAKKRSNTKHAGSRVKQKVAMGTKLSPPSGQESWDTSSREGFRRQQRRLAMLVALSIIQAFAWMLRIGWHTASGEDGIGFMPTLGDLSLGIGWAYIASSLIFRAPQTPPLLALITLLLITFSYLAKLFSFIPSITSTQANWASHLPPSLLGAVTELCIAFYSMSLLLSMPITPGGFEATVSLEERVRIQSGEAIEEKREERPMAETCRLCPTSPEDYCSLYENLSYSWMAPIQKLSLKRSLTPTDVWRLRSINDTRLLFRKFKALDPSICSSKGVLSRPSLLSKVVRANANDILLDACFKLIGVSLAYLGTFIMKNILTEIQNAASAAEEDVVLKQEATWTPRQKALVYATVGLFLTVIRFLAELQNYHHARQVGLRLRSILVVSLFEKALKRRDLSGLTRSTTTDAAADQSDAIAEVADVSSDPSALSPSIIQSSPDPNASCESTDAEGSQTPASAMPTAGLLGVPSEDVAEGDDTLKRKRSWTDSLRALAKKRVSIGSLRFYRSRESLEQSKKQKAEQKRKNDLEEMEQKRGADIGKVVNMMASDVNVLLRMGCDLHQLYGAPFEVIIATIFLYKLMGWSALVGFSILVAAIPVNYVWGEVAVKKQKEYSSARDERMNLMTELIGAMRFIKIQSMETKWEERVREARRKEICKLIWSRFMSFLFELLWTSVPVLVTLISFFFYVKVANEELTVAVAFTAIALFTMIRPPLNAIPGFLMGGFIALVSVKRLEGFLTEEEVDEAVSNLSSRAYQPHAQKPYKDVEEEQPEESSKLSITNGSFEWHAQAANQGDSQAFALTEITVSFPPAKLSVVLGPTGSGKSSLLAALLGEMLETSSDSVRRAKFDAHGNSRFSFASQLPWLEAGKNVRENITFITPFNEERYRLCVHACALEDDIKAMEDGDMTRIGAHTVSGGQKARIALARALYAETDTVLLDDVLSAVDTRVQNHLVKYALMGQIAQGRRIVIVTHHSHLLQDKAELIVCMRDGRIEAQGTQDDLLKAGVLQAHHSTKREDLQAEQDQGEISSSSSQETKLDVPRAGGMTSDQAEGQESSGLRTPRLLYEAETRRQGAVSWIFYKTYLQASSMTVWACLILFLILLRLASSFEQFWLKVWGEAYQQTADVTSLIGNWKSHLPPANCHSTFYLSIYGLTGLCIVVFNSVRAIFFYFASIQASQLLYSTLLSNVISAPLRWFDTNPSGRILNRFGTDMDGIDNILPQSIMNLANNAFAISAYFLICVIIVPWFVLPSLVLAVLGPWLVGGFLASTRDMQRIEATSTSPLYGHFQQAMSGIMTIRAFGAEPRMLESLLDAVDLYQALWWAVCTMEVWLSFRSQILGGISVFIVTLLALSGTVSPGSAGLALSSAQLLCQLAYYLVNDFKNISTSFNSLERVAEYQTMPREETAEVMAQYQPMLVPAGWPSRQSTIVFEDVKLRYAPSLPEVLKGVSFTIQPREKIGIIGRTGSGKSSLASSLFRATTLSSGRILLDGLDISIIPLRELRNRLSIVMQDPILFSGSLRDNLDPFTEYTDDSILSSMRKVGLAMPLSTRISSGGANFSAGQAQLISLARALLRQSRVLILDEATSSTDGDTDKMIQRAIRQLDECIVVCVAHRLRSVIDYDRVLVMQDGKVVEFGKPCQLLQKQGGHFLDLCRQSAEYDTLRVAAGLSEHE